MYREVATSDDEAYEMMLHAGQAITNALAEKGFAPR